MSPAEQREFDIVVYGATGFVGKLTADYLARHGGEARIALAGRSPDKLLKVRESLGDKAAGWELITADASQPSTLNALAARTRVVLTTVGPYTKYGLPLVAACAAAGTDYADLTGETMFIRDSIDHYHKQAVDTGARIVHACGFDSIPSDLTVYVLHRKVSEDGEGELGDTTMVVRSVAGGASGGTLASAMEILNAASADPEVRRQMTDPYTLSHRPPGRTRTRRAARYALAARCGDRARTVRVLDGGVRDGGPEHPRRQAQQRTAGLRLRA